MIAKRASEKRLKRVGVAVGYIAVAAAGSVVGLVILIIARNLGWA